MNAPRLLPIALSLLIALSADAIAQDKPAQPAQPAEAIPAEEIARRIQGFYDKTADFQATFQQTYTDIAAGESKKSFGRVYFKKPGKMRWDYYNDADEKKRQKVLVSDGNAFWIYEYEFQQVFKECLVDSKLPDGLRFLMGQGNLLDDFNVSLGKKSTPTSPELVLIPKKPTPRYKELRFVIDPNTYQVMKTTIFDPYGNTNEILFKAPLLNKNLPDKGFDFKVPKNARLLNPQKSC